MITAVAIVIAAACVAVSAVRLWYALAPTGMDPRLVEQVLARCKRDRAKIATFERGLQADPAASWEAAMIASHGSAPDDRVALVNEQLTELDFLLQRWSRVPRVCASICTSSGFLLAAMALRAGLAGQEGDLGGAAVDAAVLQAVDVASLGLAGAAFCIAIQMRARKAAKATAAEFDRLVDVLEDKKRALRGPSVG